MFEMPKPIVLPGSDVVRIGRQSLLIPDLGKIVVAEFAIAVAKVICNLWCIVVLERAKGGNGLGVFAIEDKRTRRTIALDKSLMLALRTLTLRFARVVARRRVGRCLGCRL